MRSKALIFTFAALAVAVGASAAAAQSGWNSGYGWWPGGYGYAPLTVHNSSWACSATAYGPTYNVKRGVWSMHYGGGTSCADGIGQKSLTVYVQTLGTLNGTPHWYTVSGTTAGAGPSAALFVRQIHARPAYLGHIYRVVAVARLVLPNAYAGHPNATSIVTMTAIGEALAP